MVRRTRFAVGGGLLVLAVAVVLPAAVMAGPDNTASVQFGNPTVGSPGPVGPGIELHDASANAQFNLVPGTVAVAAGGTVAFTVGVAGATGSNIVPHWVSVCRPGTTPDDVVDSNLATIGIDDSDCTAVGGPVSSGSGQTVSVPFSEPGRYLVICNLRPHFTEFNMYGWVNVK
jgi:plastocyanin